MGLMDLFMSPVFGLLGQAYNSYNANQQYRQAMQNNYNLMGSSLGLYGNMAGQAGAPTGVNIPQYDANGNRTADASVSMPYDQMGELRKYGSDIGTQMQGNGEFALNQLKAYQGDMMNQYRQFGTDMVSNAQNRQATAMSMLQGMGDQTRKDINTQYNANAGNIQAGLASRGLGNSTILSSMQTGNERERAGSLGRLDESLRNQALNTYGAYSGDVLNAQGTYGQNTLNMYGQLGASVMDLQNQNRANQLGWNQNIGAQALNYGSSANTNFMNALQGTNFAYPDNSWLAANQALGQGLGGYEGTQDAMNLQRKIANQNMVGNLVGGTVGTIGGSAAGGYFGGLGYGQAIKN